MPDAKHTPGPWIITQGGGIITPGGNMVAVTCSATGRHADAGTWAASSFSEAYADANARLIAAAPDTAAERDRLRVTVADLLAAAELAFAALHALAPKLDYYEIPDAQAANAYDALRAAIARARGEKE